MRTCKVYIITNDVNSKVYIGQTTNSIHERFKQHCNTKYTKLGKAITDCSTRINAVGSKTEALKPI